MTIIITPSRATETAKAMILTGGATGDLEVIQELARLAPEGTLFERSGLKTLGVRELQELLHCDMDPR